MDKKNSNGNKQGQQVTQPISGQQLNKNTLSLYEFLGEQLNKENEEKEKEKENDQE